MEVGRDFGIEEEVISTSLQEVGKEGCLTE